MERWQSQVVICKGGLDESLEVLTQGTNFTGTAAKLQNYEPAQEGGYRSLKGISKFDSAVVPGEADTPVLGVVFAHGGVYAARLNDAETGVDIYFGGGSGWTMVNSSPQDASSTKYRGIAFNISEPLAVLCDGVGPAILFDNAQNDTVLSTGPSAPKYAAIHLNRLVLAPGATETSFVMSVPNTVTSFDGSLGAVEISVDDVIVGIKVFRNELYVFCQNSIWKLVGTTTDNFFMEAVTKDIGCISGDTIQEVGGDLLFMAPDGLRSVAATARIGDVELGIVSKPIQPTVRDFVGRFSADNFSSCVIRKKSQYRFFINDSVTDDDDAEGFLGRLNPEGVYEWAKILGVNAYCAFSTYDGEDEISIIGHPTNGYVYQLEMGNSFDGRNIFSIFKTPQFTFGDATIRKVLQKISVFTQVEGDIEAFLNTIYDFDNDGVMQPSPITIQKDGGFSVFGEAVFDTDVFAGVLQPIFKKNLVGSGFTAAFEFTSNSSNAPHRIDSLQIQFAPKGRR